MSTDTTLSATPAIPMSSFFAVVDVAGKGEGLVATREIVRGTELVVEQPTVTVDLDKAIRKETSYKWFSSLTPAELLALFSLQPDETRTSHPLESRLNKLIRLEPLDSNTAVLLPVIGKANHACSPSAMLSWEYKAEGNERTCHLVTIATIPAGGEITISYCSEPFPYDYRQRLLNMHYRFTCTCPTCTLSVPDRVVHDEKILRLHSTLQSITQNRQPTSAISRIRQLASLSMTAAEDRMFVPILGVLVSLACQVCILGGDEQNARAWAELMFEWSWFVTDLAVFKNAIVCLQPRQHPLWAREVQRRGGTRETLQAPPSVVKRFFAMIKLAPTYSDNPVPRTNPAPTGFLSPPSSTGRLGPAIDLDANGTSPTPSNVPPHLRPSKSQKKRAKAKQTRKSSLSTSHVPSPSPPIGPSSPSPKSLPKTPTPASPQNAIWDDTPAVPTSPLAQTSSAGFEDPHRTPPHAQGPWRRLTAKEKKKEDERIKNAHASPVQAKFQPPGVVSPTRAVNQKVVEPNLSSPESSPLLPSTEPEIKPISNKARKRMIAAAEAEEARRVAAEEAAAARDATPPSPDPTAVPLPSSPSGGSEDEESGSPSQPLSTSQKKRLKKRAQRERESTGTSGSTGSTVSVEQERAEGGAEVGAEVGDEKGEGKMTAAQRKKLKERERRRAMKETQATLLENDREGAAGDGQADEVGGAAAVGRDPLTSTSEETTSAQAKGEQAEVQGVTA